MAIEEEVRSLQEIPTLGLLYRGESASQGPGSGAGSESVESAL